MSDLMKPRVIVTNYYPDSPFQVGDVLYKSYAQSWLTNEAHEVYTLDETLLNALKATDVEKATTCFRSLAWHEKRDIKDMPEYVKMQEEEKTEIVKVAEWVFDRRNDYVCKIEHEYYNAISYDTDIYPATEQEYTDFVNSKKQQS